MSKLRVYWDSCAWIGLINREANKFVGCEYIINTARSGETEIATSTFTLAEVFKARCDESIMRLPEDQDKNFEDFLDQTFIIMVQVDREVGTLARKLLRNWRSILKKPQDAIHLASALRCNADELHTFDGNDLIPLNGKVKRQDGSMLKICEPPLPPPDFKYKTSLLHVS